MTLRVSGKNMDIGDALRVHIESRIQAVLEKYRAGPAAGHATIEREGSGFRADCTLHMKSGATVQGDARAHDPYASFDRAADVIESQIRRHRERLVDHHAAGIRSSAKTAGGEAVAEPESAQELHPAVIAEPPPSCRKMTVSGAARELDTTNAQIIFFRHASDGRMNVVYRRADGNIGWIDPGQE